MKKQTILAVAAVLVVVGLLLFFTKSRPAGPQALNDMMMQGVSEAAAQEIGKLAGGGRKILVIQPAKCDECVLMGRLKDIFPEVARRNGLRVVATETVTVPSDNASRLSADEYTRMLQNHADVDMVVSLVGLPAPGTEPLPNRSAKVLAIATGGNYEKDIRSMFDSKLIDAAVIPLTSRPANAPQNPRTPREWFEANYQVVTPETAPPSTP